jgi:hypothetical protein
MIIFLRRFDSCEANINQQVIFPLEYPPPFATSYQRRSLWIKPIYLMGLLLNATVFKWRRPLSKIKTWMGLSLFFLKGLMRNAFFF